MDLYKENFKMFLECSAYGLVENLRADKGQFTLHPILINQWLGLPTSSESNCGKAGKPDKLMSGWICVSIFSLKKRSMLKAYLSEFKLPYQEEKLILCVNYMENDLHHPVPLQMTKIC